VEPWTTGERKGVDQYGALGLIDKGDGVFLILCHKREKEKKRGGSVQTVHTPLIHVHSYFPGKCSSAEKGEKKGGAPIFPLKFKRGGKKREKKKENESRATSLPLISGKEKKGRRKTKKTKKKRRGRRKDRDTFFCQCRCRLLVSWVPPRRKGGGKKEKKKSMHAEMPGVLRNLPNSVQSERKKRERRGTPSNQEAGNRVGFDHPAPVLVDFSGAGGGEGEKKGGKRRGEVRSCF